MFRFQVHELLLLAVLVVCAFSVSAASSLSLSSKDGEDHKEEHHHRTRVASGRRGRDMLRGVTYYATATAGNDDGSHPSGRTDSLGRRALKSKMGKGGGGGGGSKKKSRSPKSKMNGPKSSSPKMKMGKKNSGKGKSTKDDCPCFTAERLVEVAPLNGSLIYDQDESCNTNINSQRSNVRIVVKGSDVNNRPAQIRRGRLDPTLGGNSNDFDLQVDCFARDQTAPTAPPVPLGLLPDPMVEEEVRACNQLLYEHCQKLSDAGLIVGDFDTQCSKDDFDRLILEAEQPSDYIDCIVPPPPPPVCCWDATLLDTLFPSAAPAATYSDNSCDPNSNSRRANIRITRTDPTLSPTPDFRIQRGRNADAAPPTFDEAGVISCFARGPGLGNGGVVLGDIEEDDASGSIRTEVESCNLLLYAKCDQLRLAGKLEADTKFETCTGVDDFNALILDGSPDGQVCST